MRVAPIASLLLLSALCVACGESPGKGASVAAPLHSTTPAPVDTSGADPEAASAAHAKPAPELAQDTGSKQVALTPRVETISLSSEDGLVLSADLYLYQPAEAPFIVLFHQAGWSRGEYQEIAPRLGALGFNCLALDQRSGAGVNEIDNQSFARARSQKLGTGFLDALPDMRAALHWVAEHYPKAKRIGWGSSYSAALVLYLAGTEPALMDAVLAFSPGEYFGRFGKSPHFIRDAAKSIAIPSFVTSARDEAGKWQDIYQAMGGTKNRFVPKSAGNHGSRALWSKQKDSDAYWRATEAFLSTLER